MKKKLSVLAVLLLAVITTTYSVSGTYAKYTSTFEGSSSTARVAKWAFELDGETVTDNTFDFNLFETVNDTNEFEEGMETDVDFFAGVIAPGTTGSFKIKLANKSEVNAEYAIDYEVVNFGGIPIEYSVDGGNTWTTQLNDTVFPVEIAMNGEATISVQWRWAFEGSDSVNFTDSQTDETDTALGIGDPIFGNDTITVSAKIIVTQID